MNDIRPVKLLVTLGDMAGIGPEVVLKALLLVQQNTAQITLVGNQQLLTTFSKRLGLPLDDYPIIDVPLAADQTIRLGQGDAISGDLSFRSLQTAINNCLDGDYQGIVTAPIAKANWLAAGHHYPGQTELLAEMAKIERFGMLFVARSPITGWTLRTLLATTHIPLRKVADTLTPELMTLKLELLLECLQRDFRVEQPRVAIAGLNPHSGEQGQLGQEEVEWLIPWIKHQRQRFPDVILDGPVPPDTLWVSPAQAWQQDGRQGHHGYLALYHDQGLIPVKMLAFDQAVNTTIGLPFIRTSPDHGTAFDIAGQGIARPDSMVAAITLAIELATQRQSSTHSS